MKNSNVYIISDNKDYAEKKAAEISLSRKNDKIEIVGYNKIFSVQSNSNADVILMQIEKNEQAENIKRIKKTRNEVCWLNYYIFISASYWHTKWTRKRV